MKYEQIADHAPVQAFLLQGSESSYDAFLAEALVTDPFVHSLSVPRFTLDHAQALAAFIAEGTGERRTYIVFFSVFTPEAGQALLKNLEEPDADTVIILMTPYPYTVPTTIRSRVLLIHDDSVSEKEHEFSLTTRDAVLAMIKEEFATDGEDDAATRRARAIALLDELEAKVKSDPVKARTIYEAKKMLFSANLPTKFVLEYAASVVL